MFDTLLSRLNPYMLWIKIVGVVALALGAAYATHRYDKAQFDAYKDAQVVMAQKQVIAAKQKELENGKITEGAVQDYADYSAQLERQLEWLRNHPKYRSPVPQTANGAQSTPAESAEYGRTCTRDFYENGLRDAAQLNKLIDLLDQLGIPSD